MYNLKIRIILDIKYNTKVSVINSFTFIVSILFILNKGFHTILYRRENFTDY
jgi:hypothetical protein